MCAAWCVECSLCVYQDRYKFFFCACKLRPLPPRCIEISAVSRTSTKARRTSGRALQVHSNVELPCACFLLPFSCPAAGGAACPPGIRFPYIDHFCVHCPSRARHRDVGFHLFLFSAQSKQVKTEVCGLRSPSHPSTASVCVLRGFFHLSTLCAASIPGKSFEVLRTVLPCAVPQVPVCLR